MVKSLNVSESSSESCPRRLPFGLFRLQRPSIGARLQNLRVATLAILRLLTRSMCTLIVVLIIVVLVLIALLVTLVIASILMVRVVGIGVVVTTAQNEHESTKGAKELLTIHHNNRLRHVGVAGILDADRSRPDRGRRGSKNQSPEEGGHIHPRNEAPEDVPT